jgi:hypothetical protein
MCQAVGRRDRPLKEAVSWDQASFRLEGVPERRRRIDAFNPGVEHGRLGHFLCPERYEPPSPLPQAVVPVLAGGDERNILRRREVVARLIISPDFRRRRQAVETVDLRPCQISGVAAAHDISSIDRLPDPSVQLSCRQ